MRTDDFVKLDRQTVLNINGGHPVLLSTPCSYIKLMSIILIRTMDFMFDFKVWLLFA